LHPQICGRVQQHASVAEGAGMTPLHLIVSTFTILTLLGCSDPQSQPSGSSSGIAGTFYAPSWPDLPSDNATSSPAPTDAAIPDKIGGGFDPTTGGDPTPQPAPDPGLAWLLLSELHTNPEGKDGSSGAPEFIEIFHSGSEPVALAGLQIDARSWPTQTATDLGIDSYSLAPGQTLVIERYEPDALPEPATVMSEEGLVARFATSSGLRNSDGAVKLSIAGSDPSLDLVVYGGPAPVGFGEPEAFELPAAQAPENGMSSCRQPADIDTNTANDWFACSPSPGSVGVDEGDTDGAPPPIPAPPAVVIREVLANPPGPSSEEKHHEFVELINLADTEISLDGWRISDSLNDGAGVDPLIYFAGDGGCEELLCLAPGAVALVVGNAYSGPTADALVVVTDDSTLADGGLTSLEPVRLLDPDGNPHSTYRQWEDPAAEPNPSQTELALTREPGAEDTPESWTFAEPTPGE